MTERPLHRGWINIAIMLATLMQALDTTIANVAIPHMQGSLSATLDQVSWVLTSYIVAAAIMTAPSGMLAARYGRTKVFLFSVAGFTISSMLCGLAVSLPEMILFRIMQGISGAAIIPLSQSVLLDINPPEKHGQAMALWGMGVMLGPILGPTLGGYLTDAFNWRWVFFINLPVGIAAFAGFLAFLPESEPNKNRRFDISGFLMLSLAVGALQMMLDRGQTLDWFSSFEIIAELLLAVLAVYLFVIHVTTTEHPFLEPAMFRDRNYSISLLFMFVVGVIILASMALLPPFLQNLMGYPVVLSGLVMAPRGMGTMLAMALVGRLVSRVDPRYLVLFGLLAIATSLEGMSMFTIDVPARYIVITGVIQGLGLGFVFVPLSAIAYRTLEPHFRHDAAAVFSLVRNIGSSVGISIVMFMLARNIQINHADIAATLLPFGNAANAMRMASDAVAGTPGGQVFAMLNMEVNRQATVISYLNDFRLMKYVVLASIPLLVLMRARSSAPAAGQDEELAEEAAALAE